MININQRIISTTKQLITWLVNKDYKTLENFSNGIRLTADQLQEAVAEYGHTLIMPPDETFNDLDVIEVSNLIPRQWSARFDLWTDDEGRSDLSLEYTLIDNYKDMLAFELDNLHVL